MIWGLLDLSALVVHPQLNKISTIMSNASFHGTLKNIVKLANGDLQVGRWQRVCLLSFGVLREISIVLALTKTS